MSRLLTREQVAEQARIVEAPRAPTRVDRTFELPKVLYGVTVALYAGFLAILAAGLSTPGLIIPMAICAIIITGGFGVPAIWAAMKPDSGQANMPWQRFAREGISTLTGRLPARDAAVQVLILPTLIFVWGIVVVTIAGFS